MRASLLNMGWEDRLIAAREMGLYRAELARILGVTDYEVESRETEFRVELMNPEVESLRAQAALKGYDLVKREPQR